MAVETVFYVLNYRGKKRICDKYYTPFVIDRHRPKRSARAVLQIKKIVSSDNLPTQSTMASTVQSSQSTVQGIIRQDSHNKKESDASYR